MTKKYLYLVNSSCHIPQRFWTGVYLTEKEYIEKYVNKKINPLPMDLKKIELSKSELIRFKNGAECLGDILDKYIEGGKK